MLAVNRGKIGRFEKHVQSEKSFFGSKICHWKIIGIVGSKPGWDWQDHWDFTSLHISFRWWRGRSPGKKVMYPNMYIFIVCFMIWTPQQKIVYKGIK